MNNKDLISYVTILIVSFFLVADLFFHSGRSITFDGHIHITTIAQFYNALKDGDLPVRWANGFANYGLPIPIIAHQTTAYLGAFFQIFTQNAVLSYNLVAFSGALFSAFFFYHFLRYYFPPDYSLVATILFQFAPYRINNLYVRGAIPEVFASVFLPVILIGLYKTVRLKQDVGLIWIFWGTLLLALTHPMLLVLSSFVIVPYAVSLLWLIQKKLFTFLKLCIVGMLALLSASYYLVPLLFEIKYFSYGHEVSHFRSGDNFLKFPESFIDTWFYFSNGSGHPGPRANTLSIGSIESAILIGGVLFFLWSVYKKRVDHLLLLPWFGAMWTCLFLMSSWSLPLYQHIFVLNNFQYPWRNLSGLMFVPPFILAWLLSKFQLPALGLFIVIIIGIVRFPQLYGKNFMVYELSHYDFTTANLHTDGMNTLWMGNSRTYPLKTQQIKIFQGVGTINSSIIKNSYREYMVHADEPLIIADYTFYFPGWRVYVDQQPVNIEFQNPDYRGMITYKVPEGDHRIQVVFERTKLRLLGDVTTLLSLCTTGLFMVSLRFFPANKIISLRKKKLK